MKILLAGATGFIGSRLAARLLTAGHELVCTARRPPPSASPHLRWIATDYATWCTPAHWQPHVQGIDVVVNAVGIFREAGSQRFSLVHTRTPIALFEASAQAGVSRVVQLSALGAGAQAPTPYLRSKEAADSWLLALPVQGVVAQPSLVFAEDGTSARWFVALASLPCLPLPAGGRQRVQPVHVDDVVEALQALVEAPSPPHRRIAIVGPQSLTLAEYLQELRAALGLAPARTVSVPASLVTVAARIGDHLPRSLLDRSSWTMLQHGNVASPDALAALLGRPPRPVSRFIAPDHCAAHHTRAQLRWLLPLMRLSIAVVWIITGIVSLGVFPAEESFELLARAGVPAMLQPLALYSAAMLDLVLGVLTLAPMRAPRRRMLWLAQALLMLVYMVVIALKLPEFWVHPYAPMLKNLPMLAALALLATLDVDDRRQWTI